MASISLGKVSPDAAQISAPDAARLHAMTSASWKQALDPAFVDEWVALAQVAAEPNPFYEHWNLLPALKAFDPDGLVELVQFRQNGVLCGLLPVERSKSYYGYPIPHLCGWLHDNAFCGLPLIARGSEAAFWTALATWAASASKVSPFLHLTYLPEKSGLVRSLESVLGPQRPAAIVQREERALLQSDQSSDDYFAASMSGKKRKELRRQFNRLSDLGSVTFHRETDASQISDWTDIFLALESAGWKGKEGSALASNRDTEQMFRESLAGAAKAGRLERLSLSLDGRPIAMLVNFVTPPGAFSFKTTFDEDYARFSPGVLLQRENLKLLDNNAIHWADSCAAADHPMIERIWREKRSIIRINIGLGGTLRQAAFKGLVLAESTAESFGD